MPNRSMLPPPTDISWKRCPKTSCEDYGKRLDLDVGQDDYTGRGDLSVQHRCLGCGYTESGPTTPRGARRTSSTLAASLLKLRREGVVVPLMYTNDPFPEVDLNV